MPGVGRSTAAAIASFCFDEPVAILDGNVKRVLSRVIALDEAIDKSAGTRILWQTPKRWYCDKSLAFITRR